METDNLYVYRYISFCSPCCFITCLYFIRNIVNILKSILKNEFWTPFLNVCCTLYIPYTKILGFMVFYKINDILFFRID